MDQTIYLVTLVSTALVLAAAFSSLIAFRFGAPLLLLFLGLGLAAGVDGLGIEFDNARLAYFVGSLALAVILFDSGFGTPVAALRQAALPALSLATVGVMLTTSLFGAAAFYLTDFTWLESFLLGAAVASTDAAAVFFLLRAGNVHLRDRVRSTLEIESGTNDPIAIFLTITLVEVIAAGFDPAGGGAGRRPRRRLLRPYGARRDRRRAGRAGDRQAGRQARSGSGPAADLRAHAVAAGLRRRRRDRRIRLPGRLHRRTGRRKFQHPGGGEPEALSGRRLVAGADHHVPGARPVRHPVAVSGDPARLGRARTVPDLRRAARRGLALPHPVQVAAPGNGVHLLGRPARRSLDPARHHAAARRAGKRPRHLQHRLHRRARLAGHPGLDRRPAGAAARPHRSAPHRAAGKGRAGTAGLCPPRIACLHGGRRAVRWRAASASRAGRGRRWSFATAAR